MEHLFGLIGFPLGHSFSLQYFTQKFEQEGYINCSFKLFPLQNIRELPDMLQANPGIRGLAVTIPYKEQVMPYLTDIDPVAREAGAVNCITIEGNRLTGYNTDIIGFRESIRPLLEPVPQRALVLGTGGASKAVQYALKGMGIPFTIVSRYVHNEEGYTTYGQLNEEAIASHRVIINCTPLGMTPNEDTCPDIPYPYLTSSHVLYDLVYKPPMTRFLQQGAARGARIKNGYEMLLLQAEENWAIWTRNIQLVRS